MALFEINDTKPENANSNGSSIAGSNGPASSFLCKDPAKLLELAALIPQFGAVHFVSAGDWSMHDLLHVMADVTGPCDLWLSTYSITEFPLRQIANLQHAGKILSVQILIDYKAKVRYPAVFQLAENITNKIRLTNVHAKVTVLVGEKMSVVMLTSCNWTENKRIEVGVVSREQDVVAFHLKWLQKAIDNGDVFS